MSKKKPSIQSRRITCAIRDFVRAAICAGEMGFADREYLMEVMAPGVADVVASRARQFNRRRVLAARRAAAKATY